LREGRVELSQIMNLGHIRKKYKRHQAFEKTYKEIKDNPHEYEKGGFEQAKKYHYAPEKLSIFIHYRAYFLWANNLYDSSKKTIESLEKIYSNARSAPASFYILNSEKLFERILESENTLSHQIEYIRDDIREFQACMLATDIQEKQAQIEILSNQLMQIVGLENKIIETCNRKLDQISSGRVAFCSLFVSCIALIISIISLFK